MRLISDVMSEKGVSEHIINTPAGCEWSSTHIQFEICLRKSEGVRRVKTRWEMKQLLNWRTEDHLINAEARDAPIPVLALIQ